jgi:hypothetical protein
MKILIGSTGLIGTTLKQNLTFDFEYNSKSIHEYNPPNGCDLYLSCLPSTKWLVNQKTKDDVENIVDIIKVISQFNYKNIYLISTIDIYGDSPKEVDEDYEPTFKSFSYGSNRYLFEKMVLQHLKYDTIKIFRLPALFSNDIKKNILYDLLHNNNVSMINKNTIFQWYNLNNLNDDIEFFTKEYPNDKIFNLFTEPLGSEEIIDLFPHHKEKTNDSYSNIIYNYKTKYTPTGYLKSKDVVINEIKKLINEFIIK